jgi:DNA-binding CsgD family transcriptional regulator
MNTLSFSARILNWHEQADTLGLHQFRAWALAQLSAEIACNRAFWAVGSPHSDTLHDLQQHGAYSCVTDNDAQHQRLSEWLAGTAALSDPGATGSAATDIYAASRSSRIQFSCQEPQSRLHTFVVLERNANAAPFDQLERTQLKIMAPHLLAAWRHCQQLQLYVMCAANGGVAGALVDRLGFLHMADGRFFSLLRRSWPQWGGARLPEELLPLAACPGEQVIGGTRWSVSDSHGQLFITGRPLGALNLLKPREQLIALSIAAGASYQETACRYVISPYTVRNNATRIFRKLGVRNRQELGLRLWANQVGEK